jgi:hypothetical protein
MREVLAREGCPTLAGCRKKWDESCKKKREESHDMVAVNNGLDARRRRYKIGVDDGPFNANGNICRLSGESRLI